MMTCKSPYIQYMYSYPHKTAYRPLKGISLWDYAHLLAGSGHGLYLHIPFCQAKCGYCNLFSVPGMGVDAMSRYLDAVECQSRQYARILSPFHTEFSEISIGGGTPLLLPESQLERMFHILESHFNWSKDRTLVIETAPNQTVREKLKILKQAGVSRISMGIQSFSDAELGTLGRQHRAGSAEEALELLKLFDFPCVNVDFIYGIPGQTVESLLISLRKALSYEPDEIFLYPLYLKHGAWLQQRLPDSSVVFRQYEEASAFLKGKGFRQDSMRRFVRTASCPEKEGTRSFSECGFGTSLAVGCGGRSYLGNLHFCTPYTITGKDCRSQLEEFMNTKEFSPITHGFLLSEDEQKRRYVIRSLLIRPGLDLGRYQEIFGASAMADFGLLRDWMNQGYAKIVPSKETAYLTLTEIGLGLSDCLGAQLISPQVLEKMKEWEKIHGRKFHNRKDSAIQGHSEKL